MKVEVDDNEDDDRGTRARDFERVAIAAGESGNNEDHRRVHAKSSTSDARVTCTLSHVDADRPTTNGRTQGWENERSHLANQQVPGERSLLVGMF